MCRCAVVLLWALLSSACSTQPQSAKEVFATQEQAERLYQQNQYQPALNEYRKVLEILPLHIHSWLRLGNCLAQLERYPEAVEAYEKALSLEPKFASAWINLSYVQSQILAQTVAQMHQQVDSTDPQIERVQELVNSVLTPFGGAVKSNKDIKKNPQEKAETDLSDYEQ